MDCVRFELLTPAVKLCVARLLICPKQFRNHKRFRKKGNASSLHVQVHVHFLFLISSVDGKIAELSRTMINKNIISLWRVAATPAPPFIYNTILGVLKKKCFQKGKKKHVIL